MLSRIGAVVQADLRVRLRRTSTLVIFLVLCALAYKFVPDLATGRAMIQIDGHRSRYDSATIAIVTAALCSVVLGMLGFYMVSSAIRRDVVSRTGYVIAAMPVRSAEYLSGKLLGSVLFLSLVVCGYILNVMGMQLLRGEAPVEPLVYLGTFIVMTGPVILVVSALALLFECVPLLSGRLGDLVYFFVWIAIVALASGAQRQPAGNWRHYIDIFGMGFLTQQVSGGLPHASMSIGSTNFDPAKSVFIFAGIDWSWRSLAPRVAVSLLVLPLFVLAWPTFHRFDPARIRAAAARGRFNPLARVNLWLKPATRFLVSFAGSGGGVVRLVIAEMLLGFLLAPATLLILVAAMVAGTVLPLPLVLSTVLPFTFLGLAIAIADMTPRDQTAGVRSLLFTMPGMREHYLPVKFLATAGTVLLFVLVPLLRLAVARPASALSLLIGAGCLAATATAFGVWSRGPKAFAGAFLLFFYGAMNSDDVPAMDFAGFFGVATAQVRLCYAGGAVALMALLWLTQRRESA
ncbi:MAG: hypothetical protein V4558_00010 [Gemmatimonadota bacterium]